MSDVNRISRLGFVNCYLVREDDGLTLIDTTLPRSAGAIRKGAEKAEAPIVRIVLTHAHGDHIGSLDALAGELPDAEVIISERESRLLRKDLSPDPGESKGSLKGAYPGAKTRPDRKVQAGDRIGSLEVISAPGHTPGHIALLDTRDRTLYCGDVFSTYSGVATSSKITPRAPLPALATWDKPMNLQSARTILDLDPSRLAPGHGKVVASPAAAMSAAIEKVS